MLNSLLGIMRSPRLSLALIAVGIVSLAVPGAQAQGRPGSEAQRGACVAATGPDSATRTADSAVRPGVPRRATDSAAGRTAVRLFAAVEADEVRFESQPRICVTLSGDVRLDSVRVVERRNLASPVVRGTTYRDVYVAVEILGHLNADCISARITGAAPTGGGAGAGVCASLRVRDSTSSRRTGAPPP